MNFRVKLLGSALVAAAAVTLAAGSASATNNMGTLNPDGSLAGSLVVTYSPTADTIVYSFGGDPKTTLTGVSSGSVDILFDFSVVGQAVTLTYADAENPIAHNQTLGGSPYIFLYDNSDSTQVTSNATFSYDTPLKTYDAVTSTVTLQPGSYTEYVVGTLAKGTTDINVGVFAGPAVPEPATWAVMFVGFAGIGATMRSSRRKQRVAAATA